MTIHHDQRAQDMIAMSRAVLDAVTAARAALTAVNAALATGGERGVATFGFAHLMACRQPLGQLIAEHGPAVALARNELAALGVEVPQPGQEAPC